MKYKYALILFLILCGCSSPSLNSTNYRSSPFQWIYPEYFFKANVIQIDNIAPSESCSKVDFFGLSACIPDQYKQKNSTSGERSLVFKDDESHVFLISLEDEGLLMGTPEKREREKDYYSGFRSAQEWYDKVFTLTPDMITESTPTGNMWMIHTKGMFFDDTDRIEIYQSKSFIAYVKHFKSDNQHLNMEIALFHDHVEQGKLIRIAFRAPDIGAKQFLETIE